jgi:hypothetical protein
MARTPIIKDRLWKLRLSNGISPVIISQIASKSIPKFFVILIVFISLTVHDLEI